MNSSNSTTAAGMVTPGAVLKRTFMWVFLTASWGLVPGFLLYYGLGLAHHARPTRIAWGLAALVILGGGAAVGALRVMARPGQHPKSTAMAAVSAGISAAIIIDVLVVCVGGALLFVGVNFDHWD